ncbi:MAG: L,D-transpeptidase family protein [Bacillota bacterium]
MADDNKILEAGSHLVIMRSSRKLQHFTGSNLVKTYPVAVGKASTQTPLGNYKVINKIMNPGNILGTRWMGLSIPGGNYGIHGTNNPSSIGKFISKGCIRMYNRDVEELFPKISIGTPVTISDSHGETGTAAHTGSGTQGGKTYVVKKGDTLWKISRQFNVPLDEIVAVNNLVNPDALSPGQVIILP